MEIYDTSTNPRKDILMSRHNDVQCDVTAIQEKLIFLTWLSEYSGEVDYIKKMPKIFGDEKKSNKQKFTLSPKRKNCVLGSTWFLQRQRYRFIHNTSGRSS